jgi:ABC-type amino acid transport substrate-binding protein
MRMFIVDHDNKVPKSPRGGTAAAQAPSARANIMKLIRALAGALSLLFFTSAYAVSEIHTAAQESSDPKFVAIVKDGKPAVGGICVDIMRAVERVDPSLKFVGDQSWQPRLRLEAGALAGSLDVICGSLRSRERLSKFDFIDTPIFSVDYVLAVRADDPVHVENWEDVRMLGDDGIILVIQGFGVVDILQQIGGLKIDASANSSKSNLDKLFARRGRFFCHRSPGMATEIRHAGMSDKIKVLPTVMLKENFYMIVSRKMAPDNARKLSAALALLSSKGELAAMFQKYRD